MLKTRRFAGLVVMHVPKFPVDMARDNAPKRPNSATGFKTQKPGAALVIPLKTGGRPFILPRPAFCPAFSLRYQLM
jgi:hypothetical protein